MRQPATIRPDGSPPHAWGRLIQHCQVSTCACRFTPTCVGKTDLRIELSVPGLRFTPTCVGKTCASCRLAYAGMTVHPHMRGEDNCIAIDEPAHARFTPTCVGKTGDASYWR